MGRGRRFRRSAQEWWRDMHMPKAEVMARRHAWHQMLDKRVAQGQSAQRNAVQRQFRENAQKSIEDNSGLT
jgi:hypothetical protein